MWILGPAAAAPVGVAPSGAGGSVTTWGNNDNGQTAMHYAAQVSDDIVRYLAAKHAPGNLWPDNLRTRASADRWMDWQQTTFWPAIRPLFMGLIRTAPEKRDPRILEESRLKTAEVLGILDNDLFSRAYVAGDALTIGDIPLGCAIWRWMGMPIERPELRNVQRWFDSLALRPAYKSIVMLPLS